jgi:hypothetical protein
VKFLTTALRRRELRASLGPFHLISTANVFSGDRSTQPRRVRTSNLTWYFLEIGGGHGRHFIILTTMVRFGGGIVGEKG